MCMAVGRCRRCRSSTMLSGVLSVLRCRALSYFGGGSHCALAGAHATGACVARGPNSPCSWSRGAPLPLLLLPRSLRSRPPRGWRATGERCPPTAGFFSAAALASFGRLTLTLIVRIASRSRALETPFCRGSVGAPSWRCPDCRHRKTGSALKAVRGFVQRGAGVCCALGAPSWALLRVVRSSLIQRISGDCSYVAIPRDALCAPRRYRLGLRGSLSVAAVPKTIPPRCAVPMRPQTPRGRTLADTSAPRSRSVAIGEPLRASLMASSLTCAPHRLSSYWLASSASSGLVPLVRSRRFDAKAPALLVVSVLGTPMENAYAWGSSRPTTARPHFH